MGEFPARGDPSDERFEPYQTIRARVSPPAPVSPPVHLAVQGPMLRWAARPALGPLCERGDQTSGAGWGKHTLGADCPPRHAYRPPSPRSPDAHGGAVRAARLDRLRRARRAHASTVFRPAATNPCFAARRLAIMHSHDAHDRRSNYRSFNPPAFIDT